MFLIIPVILIVLTTRVLILGLLIIGNLLLIEKNKKYLFFIWTIKYIERYFYYKYIIILLSILNNKTFINIKGLLISFLLIDYCFINEIDFIKNSFFFYF